MKQQILECPHCGNKTPQDIIFQVDSMDIAYTLGIKEESIDIEIYYSLIKCSTCRRISMYVNTEIDDDPSNLGEAILCYPHEKKLNQDIPEIIAKNYYEAKKVMKISRPAFAIMIRRGLELLCQHQEAKGKTLKEKLDNLSSRSIIPSTVAEMGNTLRLLGNIGAHSADYEIDRNEIETINDFFVTMIEYVYVAPAKLAKLKESINLKTQSIKL